MTIESLHTRIEAIENGYLATVVVSGTDGTNLAHVRLSGQTWDALETDLVAYIVSNKPGTEYRE